MPLHMVQAAHSIHSSTDKLFSRVDIDIALVLLAGAALIRLARTARQPRVVGEILAGIALGPSLLGTLPGDLDQRLFPTAARPFLSAIAQLGLLLFMFTIGWELEPARLAQARRSVLHWRSASMRAAVRAGDGRVRGLRYRMRAPGGTGGYWEFALYFGVCMSVTAFPVLARILADSGLLSTKVGEQTMASAAVADVFAWCLLAAVVAAVSATGAGGILTVVGWTAVYAAVMWLVVRPLLRVLAARIGVQSFACLSGVVAAGILLSASVTEAIGIHPIFGAFAFGMVMPREPGGVLDEHMAAPFRGASAILLPVYFIVVGLSVDIAGLRGTDYAVLALVVTVACVGKVAGSALPAGWCGSSWRESTAIGILMNTRGLTELIVLNLGVTLGILDTRLFTILVLMALITTSMTGPLIDRLLHGCIRRQVADRRRPRRADGAAGVGGAAVSAAPDIPERLS